MRIKICGVTTAADAQLAARLGADAIGLNFYKKSPRFVEEARAKEIVAALPPFVEPVGVLVDPTADRLHEIWVQVGLRTLQVHTMVPPQLEGVQACNLWSIILAQGVSERENLKQLVALVKAWQTAKATPVAVLVDARVERMCGGTGQTAPWELLADFDPGLPLILAGGLKPDNVGEAIRLVRPYAVDVASGVERVPGVKDEEKLRRFIGNARDAAARYV